MKKIIHTVKIEATRKTVYQALVTRKGNQGWWSTGVKAPENISVGDTIDFTFQEGFNPDMNVTELEENMLVVWKCVGGAKEWQDNTFSFELSDEATDGTMLIFTQIYAQELSDEIYGIFNFNWGYYLRSLKQFCEEGKGFPFSS